MYGQVAREEDAELHFEVGRHLAEHLGYPRELLDAIPAEALASFAGVGYHLDLAALAPGEAVLDLGSGSGTDVFCAAVQVGASGRVVGVDFTTSRSPRRPGCATATGSPRSSFVEASIDELPFEDASSTRDLERRDQPLGRQEPRLRRGGARAPPRRPARARRHRQRQAAEGAHPAQRRALGRVHRRRDPAQQLHRDDRGRRLRVGEVRRNDYRFISERALDACSTYEVQSVSLLAVKA